MFHFDGIRRLQEVDVAQRRVLVRADLDCPGDRSGSVIDAEKLRSAVPTIQHLLEHEAQVVVAGHRFGVAGERSSLPSLASCGEHLAGLLGVEVYLPEKNNGLLTRKLMSELRPDRIVLLENLAQEDGELDGDELYARRLAEGFEVYVGDCLAGPHELASLAKTPKLCAERAIGIRAESELVALNRVQRLHGEQIVLVVGGDFASRRPLLERVLRPNLTICTGGALANTLVAAQGNDLLQSKTEPQHFAAARSWLDKAAAMGVRVLLPQDCLARTTAGKTRQVRLDDLRAGEEVVDVGLETVQAFSDVIRDSSCALMLGRFGTNGNYTRGTRAMLEEVAQSTAFSVVLNSKELPVAKLVDGDHQVRFGFVSTAGEAFVGLLCGETLAGVECLRMPS